MTISFTIRLALLLDHSSNMCIYLICTCLLIVLRFFNVIMKEQEEWRV